MKEHSLAPVKAPLCRRRRLLKKRMLKRYMGGNDFQDREE